MKKWRDLYFSSVILEDQNQTGELPGGTTVSSEKTHKTKGHSDALLPSKGLETTFVRLLSYIKKTDHSTSGVTVTETRRERGRVRPPVNKKETWGCRGTCMEIRS